MYPPYWVSSKEGTFQSSFHRLFVRDQLGLQIVQIHEKIAEIPTQIMRIALEKG